MSIFEQWFGDKKETVAEEPPAVIEVTSPQPIPKTVESIQATKEFLDELGQKRQSVLNKHRDTTESLASLGVREIEKDAHARTETYNEILNPIEEELAAISNEITATCDQFDLQPSRTDMLEKRMMHLKDLEERENQSFRKTKLGKKITQNDEELIPLNTKIQDRVLLASSTEFQAIMEKITFLKEATKYILTSQKEGAEHAARMRKIIELQIETENTLYKSKNPEYDENGQYRI